MNLKLRLNLVISFLLLIVMAVGMRVMVDNARDDIRAEVESTSRLAKRMLDTQILYLSLYGYGVTDVSPFHLQELANLRHLHIEFFNLAGKLVDSNQAEKAPDAKQPPAWFYKMLNGGNTATEVRRAIIFNGRTIGELAIRPDVSYEISEVWNDTSNLMALALVFFLLVNGIVYWAVSFALKPIEQIRWALLNLEQGNFDTRLPHLDLPELEKIASKFNDMAERLQQTQKNNRQLTKQLINLQEQERKSLARNLHDDLSQSLTVIQIETTAIQGARSLAATNEGASSILKTLSEIRNAMRNILRNLRPGSIDELGLQQALMDLIMTWQDHNSSIELRYQLDASLGSETEIIAIAIYRLVQEALTNVTRHSSATQAYLSLNVQDPWLEVSVSDNGIGFDVGETSSGFGLIGMQERIHGVGGTFNVTSSPGQGTCVSARVPIHFEEQ